MHQALLASHSSPWLFLSKAGKPLLGTDFKRDYWYPIRDGAKASTPRDKRWARPAVPAVEELAGDDIYRLRHWQKGLLDEPGAGVARVAVLYNPATAPYAGQMMGAIEDAAHSLAIGVQTAPCHDDAEIQSVIVRHAIAISFSVIKNSLVVDAVLAGGKRNRIPGVEDPVG